MAEESKLLEALALMEATGLETYKGAEATRLVKQVAHRRERIMGDMAALIQDLEAVATLLHCADEQAFPSEIAARQEIAVSFLDGARAFERARLSLEIATKDLDYLRYSLL